MSKIKKISHILVALLLASAAGGLVWHYVRINTPGVKVAVAAEKLPIGTALGTNNVTLKDYPESVVPKDAETSLQNVTGKTVVSGTVFPGEVIRKGHIAADTGSLKAVLGSLAPGREAIDLPAETSTGMRGITAGDRVNVFTEITIGKDASAVECVAREAVVIKVPPVAAGKENSLAASASKGAYVIAVTPEEARKVAEGIVRGKKFSITLLSARGVQ
ncbi:MAG: hypothetical protein K6T65_06545 [Peptococcaceae bacterium]|nr:hypothetical protein [Peptococcaceae bacterium]